MDERRRCIERRASGRRHGDSKNFGAYEQMSSAQKHDEMIKTHLKLVSFVAARLAIGLPNWIDKRDLISAGVIGLIDAAKHFDPQKGVKFGTFASTRIRGAIIDELRALDWIPRSTREKSKQIERSVSVLIGKHGRLPTDSEIADELGWDMDKYYKTLDQVSGTTLLSLDEIITSSHNGENIKRIDTVHGKSENPLKSIEKQELKNNIVKAIGSLSEQERLVIALYYYEELTLKEIGIVMKVSESRVSQVHTAAIIKIRAKLSAMYSGI